ncbi:MAG: O-antigen ligase family protein [Terriglobia bacterium]
MKKLSAVWLLAGIAAGVSVMWLRVRWATALPEILIFSLAMAWLAGAAAGRWTLRWKPILLPMGAVVLWGAVQAAGGFSVYPYQTWVLVLYWAANLAAMFAAIQFLNRAEDRDFFLKGLLFFGVAVSAISFLQAFTSDGKVFWFFTTDYPGIAFGPFVYNNQYAAFIELLLPIALFYALTDAVRSEYYAVMAAVLYMSVVATASRAGFVLSTIELLLVPALLMWKRGRTAVHPGRPLAFAGVAIVLLILAAGPSALLKKFQMTDPYAGRREFLYSSVQMVKARPLVGVGLGNWATAYPAFTLFDDGLYANQAHNDWAQWAVEGGAPMFFLMLWFVLRASSRGLRSVWGAGIAIVFCHCFVDYPIQRIPVAFILFALAGAAEVAAGDEPRAQRLR